VSIGKLIMIGSYLPIAFVVMITYNEQKKTIHKIIKIFIEYVCIAFIILLVYFSVVHMVNGRDIFDISIYSLSIIFDIVIISLSIVLLLINMPTQIRYLFTIIFGFYSLCFIGDCFNLLKYLSLYDPPIYPQYFYDGMVIFASGTLLIYALSNIKITTIEEVNKKLRDTSLVVEDLIMQSPDVMCMCDINGNIIKANNVFKDMFNIKEININIFDLECNTSNIFNDVTTGKTVHIDTFTLINSQNVEKHLSVKLYPTYSSDNKISNYIFVAEDITTRKNAENALKIANDELENRVIERTSELLTLNKALQKEIYEHGIDEEKIKTSLKEKEVLLKEIHHRVKNNMQIISSMLGLQSSYINDQHLNEILNDSQNRIKSMALIHEKLYQSNNMANINFSEYVNSLISNLQQSYSFRRDRIIVNKNIENVSFNIDTAIPLGLIINEILSNTYKHAFPIGGEGIINITIKTIDKNQYILDISDNGIGLPQGFDIENNKSLGLKLVNVLTDQIGGKLEIGSEIGVRFTITFCSN
jgi:two-component sensor histidine kinase